MASNVTGDIFWEKEKVVSQFKYKIYGICSKL
jgi:hypothetical protein